MRRIVFVVSLSLLVFLLTTSVGGKDRVYTLRASTNLSKNETVGRALQYFVDLVNERSGGRIKAVAYFGAELGTQKEQVEMCRTGSLEMVVAAPGTGLGAWVPQLVLFEFPFLFKDNAHYRRVLAAMTGEVTRLVEPYGFVAAAGQSQGVRNLLTIEPVYSLADMKGKKMRGPNPIYIRMFECLGATGITTDWNEIYTALQTRMIDGMEASPSSIYRMRFHEVAKNMTMTGHIIACVYYFFNKDWLNGLPKDLKEIVLKCAEEAAAYQAKIDDEDQEKALKALAQEGVNIIELKDRDEWVKACSGMLDEYRAKGKEWSDFLDKLLSVD